MCFGMFVCACMIVCLWFVFFSKCVFGYAALSYPKICGWVHMYGVCMVCACVWEHVLNSRSLIEAFVLYQSTIDECSSLHGDPTLLADFYGFSSGPFCFRLSIFPLVLFTKHIHNLKLSVLNIQLIPLSNVIL